MEISPLRLFYLLISSFAFGHLLGVLYDLHRIIRVLFGVRYTQNRPQMLFAHPLPLLRRPLREIRQGRMKKMLLSVVIFFQDVFLGCAAGIGLVILNYVFNDGQLRFYTVLAMTAGFFLYYVTIGKLVIFLSEWIVFFLRAIFAILLYLLSRPVVWIYTVLEKTVKKTSSNLKKALANHRKKVYNINKVKNSLQLADHGFL